MIDQNDLIQRVCGHAEPVGQRAAEWLARHYDEDGYADEEAKFWFRNAQARICLACLKAKGERTP